jgi:hypothetical protein
MCVPLDDDKRFAGTRKESANHQVPRVALFYNVRSEEAKWVAILRAQQERDVELKLAQRFGLVSLAAG